MLFRFLILVHVCVAFPLKCPEPAQWSLRARGHCPDPSRYFCLKNDLINGYSENCTVFDFLQPGRKSVLRGGLDADICSLERFQPWPINFYTNVSTKCIFIKSLCHEEGQVVYDNGNRNRDTTCKCDYTKGYDFVVKPKKICFCIPWEEDCSCYIKTCPDSTFNLSPDYDCIQSGKNISMNISMSQCRPIISGRFDKDEVKNTTRYISRKDNISNPVLWKTFAGISTIVVCIGLIIVLSVIELLDKYYCKAYYIFTPPDCITCVESQSVLLKYKLLINRFKVVYKRNDVAIITTNNIKKIEAGRSKILQIIHITSSDEGEYCLEVAGNKSKPTQLVITPLFKYPLKDVIVVEGFKSVFECETEDEDENSHVEWSKDGVRIISNTENKKMVAIMGRVYKLTIIKTSFQDRGRYCIQKNGIRSEALLDVKALIKRPLQNATSVEGLNTVFECETEDENSPVEWFKDGNKITDNTENIKMETLPGYIYKLTIAPTSLQDSGKFSILKNGIFSEATLTVKALFKRPLENETSVEGLNTVFECETENENSPVEWFKDGYNITDSTENIKMETLPGFIYKLTIAPTSLQDSGKFSILKNGIFSKATLTVKGLFKRPLQNETSVEGLDTVLECKTENVNSPVEWFKDGNKITDSTEDIKMETLPGFIYKLSIAPTSLQDSGKFKIKKKGVCSEATLTVKAMFKRPLTDLTTMEGSTAYLECETERENCPFKWFKDDEAITDKTENIKMEAIEGCIFKLTINHTSFQDKGKYSIKKNGICSQSMLNVKALFKRQLQNRTSLEGLYTVFECETEDENSPVEWFKDGKKITDNTENIKMETLPGFIYKLTIAPTRLQDSGKFSIQKNGVCSKATLIVKALFKRPLQNETSVEGLDTVFECETENENSPVEWFKDGKKITDNTENIKMETLPGFIYKLTIASTSHDDSGKFSVQKNGVFSEAKLTVKALFKRPLSNITIMEGLDTIFECETEYQNCPTEWFKDGALITSENNNMKMEILPENIHKLTITNTSLRDKGKYSIEMKGMSSKAVLDIKEMPETIKQMSVHDREEFLKAAKSGTARRYYVRVMIIGENSVGKTCLLRRLLHEQIKDVDSTDGIDIQRRRCQINMHSWEWIFSSAHEEPYSVWSNQSNELADVGFWDFAGQKEFYATHQVFLSRNAVYLLVTDISKEFKKKTYNTMIENQFDCIGGYIDFWLDNIHCYCIEDQNIRSELNDDVERNPPVLIIGTGIDKIASDERDKKIRSFTDYISNSLSDQEKRRHLRRPHFLSNTSDSDLKFELLRQDIVKKAKTLPNWGDLLPTRWIVLEKEIYMKISKKKYVISYDKVKNLATKCSFPDVNKSTSELDSFLKYEHDIGNIIFFEDVKNYIILDAKWLVEVFKCFVSHKFKDELVCMPEWSKLEEKGILSNSLILKLLEKERKVSVTEQKQFVLQIMEKFDIIVRPINDTAEKLYYMPCMMKAEQYRNIVKKYDLNSKDCKRTSWFCLEFDFLPPAYFNNILVNFVRSHLLSVEMDDRLSIYRNIGIFDLDSSGSQKLVICLCKNFIAMQVWQWSDDGQKCYSEYQKKLLQLVSSIRCRYRMNINYKKKFKCSWGSFHETTGRIDFNNVIQNKDVFCEEHMKMHQSIDIFGSWLTEEDIKEEYEKNGCKKCHTCVKMSLDKCNECNIVLCKDCSREHKNATMNRIHLIQRDGYILNTKFSVDEKFSSIRDIKCLPNGLIIATTSGHKQIMVFSSNGEQRQSLSVDGNPVRICVVDSTTILVSLWKECGTFSMAKVDIQQRCVLQYVTNNHLEWNSLSPFLYMENQLYVACNSTIVVIDMSGKIERVIDPGFTPYDMCYDCDSEHIYCIDQYYRKLFCIDKSGRRIFTFADQNMKNSHSLTIDKSGNVLVPCTNKPGYPGYVTKVDYKDQSSRVVITNIQILTHKSNSCICFDLSTNSMLIGVDDMIYIYKNDAQIYDE